MRKSNLLQVIHIFLGVGGVLGALVGFEAHCFAYCRTHTCEFTASASTCTRDAEQCVSEGIPIAWNSDCLPYAVQLDGAPQLGLDADQLQRELGRAFARWQDVDCPGGGKPGFEPVFTGFVACERQQVVCGGADANVTTLIVQEENWPTDYPKNAAALTSVIADLGTGEIIDADLELNVADYEFNNEGGVRLSYALTHEVGHLLGLAHTSVPAAMMNLNYSVLKSLSLSTDDAAGICEIFPPADSQPDCGQPSPAYDLCAEFDLSTGQVCTEPEPEEVPVEQVEEMNEEGCQISPVIKKSENFYWPMTAFFLMFLCKG